VVLKAEPCQFGELCGGDIQEAEGVVLLQRNVSRSQLARNGDVLGFEILRHAGVAAIDTDGVVEILLLNGGEIGRADGGLADADDSLADIDDRNRALRIGGIVVAWFALVGGQDAFAVGGEGNRVRLRANGHGTLQVAVRVLE